LKVGRGKLPALVARYSVEGVSPNRMAASSTLRSGLGDFEVGLLRMGMLLS